MPLAGRLLLDGTLGCETAYMAEYPIARFYADARIQSTYRGTTEIMKDLIARRLGT